MRVAAFNEGMPWSMPMEKTHCVAIAWAREIMTPRRTMCGKLMLPSDYIYDTHVDLVTCEACLVVLAAEMLNLSEDR